MENANAEPGKEYVYTIEHEVNVVNLRQGGCGVNKIDERKTARDWDPKNPSRSGDDRQRACVSVCPKWFGNSKLEQSDGATCLRGANGKSLCEKKVETHLAKESFLRFGDGHEPLIRRRGVYFVKAQTVNACVRADGFSEKKLMRTS